MDKFCSEDNISRLLLPAVAIKKMKFVFFALIAFQLCLTVSKIC